MASRERQKLQCCCCSTVTIVIVTLIATSIKPIDPNTVAIEYNPNTQSIDESKLYGPGRPFLGPGHYFVKFPTQNENTQMDLVARTKDGLAITLSLSFNFRLKPCIRARQCPSELAQLYLQIGTWEDIKAAYGRISRNSLRTVAAKYYAFDYFSEQGDQLKAEMQNTLNRDLGMWKADVDSFQLTRINLGREFEAARAEQEAALQEQLSVVQSKKNNVTHWAGVIKRVNETAQLIVKSAEAQRHQIEVNAAAAAASLKARVDVEADSFRRARGTLNFTSKELLAWVWLDAMKSTAASSTVIDVETPELISTAGY